MTVSEASGASRGPLVTLSAGSNPLGRGDAAPQLGWRVSDAPAGWRQDAVELRLASLPGTGPGREPATAVLTTSACVDVDWPFAPLTSRERVAVTAAVRWRGRWSSPSEPIEIEAGLLGSELSRAAWVGPDDEGPACPMLRREFTCGSVVSARLYLSARGLYCAWLNGQRVGDQVLTPGWTDYRDRFAYQVYDVTEELVAGANCLGVMLADGWYRGRLGWEDAAFPELNRDRRYGEHLAVLALLQWRDTAGCLRTVVSDETWTWRSGPVVRASWYDGEEYDATREVAGWSRPGAAEGWGPVVRRASTSARLVGPCGPPVRRRRSLEPVASWPSRLGGVVVDFGRNIVGRVRLPAAARGEICVHHAEIVIDGELETAPLRTARATDTYHGLGRRREPEFSVHGFRYARVVGLEPDCSPYDLRAQVIGSDLVRTGWFACDRDDLNALHANVVTSAEGNFVSIPTDCPQRDERLGWTGDLQVFAPAAASIFDVSDFLASWLVDLAGGQRRLGGVVPLVVPDVLSDVLPAGRRPMAAWGDAAVVVPWVLYERYGCRSVLERQYDSISAWIDQVAASLDDDGRWPGDGQYGDWLDPAAPAQDASAGRTSPQVVATAYAARSAGLAGQVARVLGRSADAARFEAVRRRARHGFSGFVSDDGSMAGGGVTGYCLALQFGLVEDTAMRARVARQLVGAVREAGHRIATGFVGTPLVLDTLVDVGAVADAYALLTQRSCPSWLYPISQGATSIWERWDSLRPDGTLHPAGMTSFNHYAFGAVADFLHRRVGGLAPAAPGYRTIEIAPVPGPGVGAAEVVHDTPYGRARVAWRRGARLSVEAEIPPGTTGIVRLPGLAEFAVGHGRHSWVVEDTGRDEVR